MKQRGENKVLLYKMPGKFSILLLTTLFIIVAGIFGLSTPIAMCAGEAAMPPVLTAGFAGTSLASFADGYTDEQEPLETCLEIKGNGVTTPKKYTLSQLQGMEQYRHLYSTINTWPTKNWYAAEGVKLKALLEEAGIKDEAKQIRFTSSDGFIATFTVQELLKDDRYLFPYFRDNHEYFGYIPGSPADAEKVEPILALKSAESNNFNYMSGSNALHLIFGQRVLTEQTNAVFAKKVALVEVLTDNPDKWAAPTATPTGGEVPAGTLVQLSSTNNNTDKVYYTLDGSVPTVASPMYNWIAQQWWLSREDVLEEINHPIELTKDTTIKAIVIGPGKEDSDIVEFNYTIEEPDPISVTGVSISESDRELEEGRTVQLTAQVEPENVTNNAVTWSSSDENVATVNETGLVTAVSAGTAEITVTTGDGNYKDSITVTVKAAPEEPSMIVSPPKVFASDDFSQVFELSVTNDTIIRAVYKNDIKLRDAFESLSIKSVTKVSDTTVTAAVYGNLGKTGTGIIALAGDVLQISDHALTAKIEVVDDEKVAVTGVSISEVDQELGIGKTVQLTAKVQPEDATNKNVTWSSNNEVVAMVSDSGLVIAVSEGTATITVTSEDGGFTGSISVTVKTADSGQQPGDGDVALTITGDGVTTPKEFTQLQLEEMRQYQNVYSCINTWPSKKWYVGKGVSLRELLDMAGMKGSARQINFIAKDGYSQTLTVQELLKDKRYRFPNFKSGSGADGHIPGSSSGAVEVEPILALVSAEGTEDPGNMNDVNALLLMLGQRAVTEQTGPLFVKRVTKIEVLTSTPEKWDEPTAEPAGGTVPAGTKVVLSSQNNEQDKAYYTTDGSTPNLDSPMYNLIAQQWWSSREDVLAEINRPIELTKDTTIKAITIGAGKSNSKEVTFTYKVTGTPTSTSEQITAQGGTVGFGEEAFIEMPAGALPGIVEVKIDRVTTPPAAPAGFKLLGVVYEFTVDGKTDYSFNKAVTIKFRFDPGAVPAGETPTVHYYDENGQKWVDIGGEVSGETIIVQVEHFTKFAVMVAVPTIVTATIEPGKGGTVSLGEEAVIDIPAGALPGTAPVEVKIERVAASPAAPACFKLLGGVYEFSVDGRASYSFNKAVTIKLVFDPGAIPAGETPAVQYYNETEQKWVDIGGEVSGETIIVQVEHLTKFAVTAPVEAVVVINLTIGEPAATVNGIIHPLDAAPCVDTRAWRTLVPVRFISEFLGAEVEWLPQTCQVRIKDGDKEVILTLDSGDVLVNGIKQTIDSAPSMLQPGRTFIPLRFVSETMGVKVEYKAETREITITR